MLISRYFRIWTFATFLTAFVCSVSVSLAADEYVFDKDHSSIQVSYDHLGLARQTLRFLDFDGTVLFDAKKPAETVATVTVKTNSVTSDLKPFDKKLAGKDYFNAEKHPKITFKTQSAKRTGQNTGTITGDLTINGISKPVTFDVLYRFSGKHPLGGFIKKYKGYDAAGFSASAKVLRSDFGMGAYVPLVSDEVRIVFEMELLRKAGE